MTRYGFLLLFPILFAQAPPDGSTSLEDTMKFIQDKLGETGPINHLAYYHDKKNRQDWTAQFNGEISNVRASAADCRITFHWRASWDGVVFADGDPSLSLKLVQEIEVVSREQELQELNTAAGHSEWSARVDRPLFVVRATVPNKRYYTFYFYDEAVANRVAKALAHCRLAGC
jgi:hypothetical protein